MEYTIEEILQWKAKDFKKNKSVINSLSLVDLYRVGTESVCNSESVAEDLQEMIFARLESLQPGHEDNLAITLGFKPVPKHLC